MKSVRSASHDLEMPHSMVCDVLHKHLKFKACKLQLVNGLTEPDEALHLVFSTNVQKLLENDKYRKKGNTDQISVVKKGESFC